MGESHDAFQCKEMLGDPYYVRCCLNLDHAGHHRGGDGRTAWGDDRPARCQGRIEQNHSGMQMFLPCRLPETHTGPHRA